MEKIQKIGVYVLNADLPHFGVITTMTNRRVIIIIIIVFILSSC